MSRPAALAQALLISGTLNVLLLGGFFYMMVKEKPYFTLQEVPSQAPSKAYGANTSLSEACSRLVAASLQEKLPYLLDTTCVDEGISMQQLALALLVEEHCFDLERGLSFLDLPKEKLRIKVAGGASLETRYLELFSDITQEQYRALHAFGREEMWPLTEKGIFCALQQEVNSPTLLQAFSITTLYHKLLAFGLPQKQMLFLALQLEYEELLRICSEARARVAFLEETLLLGSAELFLTTEYVYCLQELSEEKVYTLLELLPSSKLSLQFYMDVMRSHRSEKLCLAAAEKLAEGKGAETFSLSLHKEQERASTFSKGVQERGFGVYTVLPGDSLWKIAKEFAIPLAALRQANHLEDDTIYPGMVLYMPHDR